VWGAARDQHHVTGPQLENLVTDLQLAGALQQHVEGRLLGRMRGDIHSGGCAQAAAFLEARLEAGLTKQVTHNVHLKLSS
jgi:hypothetical protein